jgi:glutamyl-tRNA synthetase
MAPTPSAGLHVGNIFSCLVAWLAVKSRGGRIVLRIEDVDRDRCRREYADQIMRDLETLGLTWDNANVLWQGDREEAYDGAFAALDSQGLLYPCFCSRADLHAASAPHAGERYLYAGTCFGLTPEEVGEKRLSRNPAYRLHVPDLELSIDDAIQGSFSQNLAHECGDFIVRRSDGIYAYQLAVVVDDLAQGVTQVVRGCDLLDSAPQQDYLRSLLDPEAPCIEYAHVPLLLDEDGRRFSKRDRDVSLDGILERFESPTHFIGYLAHATGLAPDPEPRTPEDLAASFSFEKLAGRTSITWRFPE